MSSQSTKGKNFSANNASGKRKASDFYETPYSITEHLLKIEPFDKSLSVLEPAQGAGAITKVLGKYWNPNLISAYDIEKDFLTETRTFDYIITNPPFSLAFEFIQHARAIASRKFALLLPLAYLHGKRRFDEIYSDRTYGLKSVSVFTRYPMLGEPLRDDGKYNTGMMVYAWYVFENGHSEAPIIRWLDNHHDVLTKEDRLATEPS